MNGDAFYISTKLVQQQQLLDFSPSCCTSLGPSLGTTLGTSLSTLLGTSLGICTLLALVGARGGMYPNYCASSNARKLTLNYGLILNTNLGHKLSHELGQSDIELGQSDVDLGHELGRSNIELGQSDVNSNLTDEPPDEPLNEPPDNLNETSVEHPSDEPPDEPIDEPPGINLMFCFDPILNVADFSFCFDTNTCSTINLDNPGSGDTCENLGTDPGNDPGITAPFKLNASLGAELDVGGTVTGIDERGLGNNYSQASITGHTQTSFSWNQLNLWYLAILYTIYCLIARPSANDCTASSYFNLLLVTTTSLS